ncbi:MAG: polysaccharide export protein [Acidobacteriales bacterium]|nr:polysaccharide export protein [Terriglobales bacterium]
MSRYVLLLLVVSATYPQEVRKAAEPPQAQSPPLDYRLGPSDVLSISVLGLKDFDRSVTVSNSGRIRVPHIGILNVLDMTTLQLETDLARRLRERNLVKDPWVQVRVTASRSQAVYVLGEVIMPGQYLLKDGMRVLDLVSLGLGVNDVTSTQVYLYRQRGRDSDQPSTTDRLGMYEVAHIDLQELFQGKKPELNVRLQGGDILYCPEKKPEFFYVIGDLVKPGPIEMISGQTVMASRAVSWAGGPTKTAKLSKGIVLRYDKTGARQEFAVDFKALLAGKKADFAILPNDVVFIPGSAGKTLAYGLLSIVPGVGTMSAVMR